MKAALLMALLLSVDALQPLEGREDEGHYGEKSRS